MTDLEKLNKYHELVLSKKKRTQQFDDVEIKIHGNTIIREHWSNKENQVSKTWAFPFSMIDFFNSELEKSENGKKTKEAE